jgi:acyl-CoA synthetase (AMP-forming)/AMP-acid ligase II
MSFGLSDDYYLSSGRALRGMNIRIVQPQSRRLCAEGEAGDIHLKTVSLFRGYWGSEGFTTHAFTDDGWYATGDFGFVLQGELFVIGRLKDIIIVAGQNVFPEDVELAANAVVGVYSGRVASFGVIDEKNGTESLVVVAELRGDFDPQKAQIVERAIHQAVLTSIGIAPRQVVVVPDRWIVKSTAGKIARRETRERFLREIAPHSHERFVSKQGVQ